MIWSSNMPQMCNAWPRKDLLVEYDTINARNVPHVYQHIHQHDEMRLGCIRTPQVCYESYWLHVHANTTDTTGTLPKHTECSQQWCWCVCSWQWTTLRAFVVTCVTSKFSLSQAFRISNMMEHYSLELSSSLTFYRSTSGPRFIGPFWLILTSQFSPDIYST